MGKRRAPTGHDDRQLEVPWADPREVMRRAEARGPVVFEAPASATSRLTRTRVPRVRVAAAARDEILSLGLPFGVTADHTCWACGAAVESGSRVGPGLAVCPGCGAKLPFED